MCIMCAYASLSLRSALGVGPNARALLSAAVLPVLRCSFSEGKSAATLCVLLQSAHLPCMYTRENEAHVREESTKLLLSALGSIFTFVYFCQLALCVYACCAGPTLPARRRDSTFWKTHFAFRIYAYGGGSGSLVKGLSTGRIWCLVANLG
jgi:hypothetical protein